MMRHGSAIIVPALFLLAADNVPAGDPLTGPAQPAVRRRLTPDAREKTVAANPGSGPGQKDAVLRARSASPAEHADPVLRLSRARIDFGEISSTQTSEVMVEIENISRAAVCLRARTSCGCARSKLAAEYLPAGRKTTMTILFNPAEKSGHDEVVEQIALFYHQNGTDRRILIPLRAKLRQYFRVRPREINFGDIHRGGAYSAVIEVDCNEAEWGRAATVTPPVGFDASVVRSESALEKAVRVEVKRNAHPLSGPYAGAVIVSTKLRGQPNEIHVPIHGRFWDTSLRCEPALAELGFIRPHETRILECTLTSCDGSSYVIENVSADLGEVRWSLREDAAPRAPGPERSQQVRLELKAAAQQERILRGCIWFDIRHGEARERLTLVVKGYADERKPPRAARDLVPPG